MQKAYDNLKRMFKGFEGEGAPVDLFSLKPIVRTVSGVQTTTGSTSVSVPGTRVPFIAKAPLEAITVCHFVMYTDGNGTAQARLALNEDASNASTVQRTASSSAINCSLCGAWRAVEGRNLISLMFNNTDDGTPGETTINRVTMVTIFTPATKYRREFNEPLL